MDTKIFRISKDFERGKSLLDMSKERLEIIGYIPKDKAYKIIEDYYEIVKELLTAIMYIEGYKTLSHVSLIAYFKEHHSELTENQVQIVDRLRKHRNGIVYYGKKVTSAYLENNEDEIKIIINELVKVVEKELEN